MAHLRMQVRHAALILLFVGPAIVCGEGVGTIEFDLELGTALERVGQGASSDMSVVLLDEDTAILCSADRPRAQALCWTLSPGSFMWRPTQWYPADDREVDRFAMARLSSTLALMCYRLLEAMAAECTRVNSTSGGQEGVLLLDVEGVIDLSVACLTETECVVCYATSGGRVSCAPVFSEEGMPLATGRAIEVSAGSSVAVAGFSHTNAVVCHQAEGASCSVLTVHANRSLSLGESKTSLFSQTREVDVARLSDNSGVACYVMNTVPQYGVCVPLWLEEAEIHKGMPQAELSDNVNVGETQDITVVGISDTAAVVCYLEGVNRAGMCSGLVLNRPGGLEDAIFEVGEHKSIAFELQDGPDACSREGACTNFLTASSALSPVNEEAVLCYARHDAISCRMVGVPAPTTTLTTTSTITQTTTSPHTTTETSTTQTTTSLHTTTETTTTIPDSAASKLAASVSVAATTLVLYVAIA